MTEASTWHIGVACLIVFCIDLRPRDVDAGFPCNGTLSRNRAHDTRNSQK